jgi:hypothetical protein
MINICKKKQYTHNSTILEAGDFGIIYKDILLKCMQICSMSNDLSKTKIRNMSFNVMEPIKESLYIFNSVKNACENCYQEK